MTEDQLIAIKALNTCTFLPGCFDKRFARTLVAFSVDHVLTEKQDKTLFMELHRYRRQIPEAHNKYCRQCKEAEAQAAIKEAEEIIFITTW